MASVHQRYRILSKLDTGGMAEIYRAVSISIEGFEKPVAIKRILPSKTQDPQFVAMFLDEARLTMQLNHANIVQIYDIGQADGAYFLALEMVDGWNLRRVMQMALDQGKQFPVALACFVAMELSKALAYAHEKTGPDGHSLGIVHRDVSPPNLLLSRQGEVKLTDFGLARAATNAQESDHGVVKGKYAYLCPEAVEGKVVDPRADVFSSGIILWELLCGRRLFGGSSDGETIELVRKCEVPSAAKLRSDVDDELDKILTRSLAKNPKRRFQSAREFEQELAAYLFKHNLRVTGTDLVGFLRELAETGRTETVDVAAVLRAEHDEQVRAGLLDPAIGLAPLRPDDLKAKSTSKIGVQGFLARLSDAPLDDLAELGLAERLEGGAERAGISKATAAPAGRTSTALRWAVAAFVVAAVAAGAYFLSMNNGPGRSKGKAKESAHGVLPRHR